jgi:tRNAThr (cytosine32-N3)-methyltransferase
MTEIVDDDGDSEPTSLSAPSQVASPTSHTPADTPNPGSDDTPILPSSGSSSDVHHNLLRPLAHCPPHPLFTIEQLGVDRRLLVNRKRQLKMYRIWMQGKFRKAE